MYTASLFPLTVSCSHAIFGYLTTHLLSHLLSCLHSKLGMQLSVLHAVLKFYTLPSGNLLLPAWPVIAPPLQLGQTPASAAAFRASATAAHFTYCPVEGTGSKYIDMAHLVLPHQISSLYQVYYENSPARSRHLLLNSLFLSPQQ